MKPLMHRATLIMPHSNPEKAVSIDEFIDRELATFVAADLARLKGMTDSIRAKMDSEQARCHYDLVTGAELLVRILETLDNDSFSDPLPRDLAAAGVAAAYILKSVDFIPDSLPEIGLTDDARILARVLERHPSLWDYSSQLPA